MNYFDIAIMVIVFIFIVMGFRKGLVAEVVGLLGMFVALMLAVRFASSAAKLVPEQLNLPPVITLFMGFLLVFGGVILFFKFVANALKKIMHPKALNWFDKLGGIVLGGIEGVITASVLIFLFSLTPLAIAVEKDIDESLLYAPVEGVAPQLFDLAHQMFPLDRTFAEIKNGLISKIEGSSAGSAAERAASNLRPARPTPQQQSNRSTSSGVGQRGRK